VAKILPATRKSARGNDGLDPQSGLIVDNRGTLYGTTTSGTVFKLTPPAWTEKVLFNFTGEGNNGSWPCALISRLGSLYDLTRHSAVARRTRAPLSNWRHPLEPGRRPHSTASPVAMTVASLAVLFPTMRAISTAPHWATVRTFLALFSN
jgi:hypothetical protein